MEFQIRPYRTGDAEQVAEIVQHCLRAKSWGGRRGGTIAGPGGTFGPATPAVPVKTESEFHATPGEVITIAAATGGHVAAVERFAVTGAHAG